MKVFLACVEAITAEMKKEEEEVISAEDLEQVEDIIEQVAEEKKIALEKKSLEALKEDVEEYKEVHSNLSVSSALGYSFCEIYQRVLESKHGSVLHHWA